MNIAVHFECISLSLYIYIYMNEDCMLENLIPFMLLIFFQVMSSFYLFIFSKKALYDFKEVPRT